MDRGRTDAAELLVAAGPRATEALLLEGLASLVEAGQHQWGLLAKPVRIVVPSRSLRDHVSAVLVRRFGHAVAGVQVQTLPGMAREILERMQDPAVPGEALVPILVRRAAAREPLLVRELGGLVDGFGAVLGSVRDLLDAGLVTEGASAIDDALASLALPAAQRERASALVRVTRAVTLALETLGADSRTSILRRALDALRRDAGCALPQRAVFVHGFADATGVATDLIEALARSCAARVLLDRPLDPADRLGPDLGCAFTERFAGRLASVAARVLSDAPSESAPSLALLEAPGADAEVRGVAVRIRALLASGVPPESIGVVARSLTPYATRFRTQFERLGIPFSTLGQRGGLDGVGRKVQALLELLERGLETPTDRWLDGLAARPPGAVALADLRMALHALGAARLEHVAELDLAATLGAQRMVSLPVRHGLGSIEAEDGEPSSRARRRQVPRDALAVLVRAARSLRDALSSWPEEESIGARCAWLRRLLVSALGWEGDEPAQAPSLQALDQLAEELPDEVEIDRAEFLLLLREAFAALGSRPIGGAGAGVPVLDAIQARARTFEHLFVLGLNRDVFPRVVLEDPLLPDALRAALVDQGRGVVPDLPLKLGGFDEERYLFAQLLSASPRVTLSWQSMDDDGKERAASTLVERIRLAAPATSIEKLPTLWSPMASTAERPADEHATLAALHGSRAAVARILPLAVGDAIAAGAAAPGFSAAAAAAARMAALEMLEPRGDARDTLGAAFGFVGERRARDERDGPLAITTLERIAVCPWQAFLGRVLHLEPAPDALEALPAIDALLLGTVLHATIEEIVKSAIPGESDSLEAARSRGSFPVPWPGEEAVRRILGRVAAQALRAEGLGFAGLAQVTAERVLPMVREVFRLVWLPASGTPTLFGAELTGTLRVRDDDARLREIRFRADLAEAVGPLVRLIDLKSGKPISLHKREATRQAKLLEAVASGKRLQTTAYACAVEGEGRYLFADPERSGEQPVASVMHDTPDVIEAFDAAVRTLLAAWDRGSFLPRLELPEGVAGDPPCGHCQVSEACVPGDSGARMRLRRWAALGEPVEGAGAAALRSARAVFQLPARKSDPDAAGGEDA